MATKNTPAMPEDKVVVASRRQDGTPDQSPGYEIIGDKEAAKELAAAQLGQMLVSAADQKRLAEEGAAAAEQTGPTAEEQKRIDEHEALLEQGRQMADAEVEAKFTEPAARQTSPEETTSRRKTTS